MSTNQKSKTDNQKFVNKMLSILFANHKYTPETKDKGIDFLHTLLENKTYGGVNILSTSPIFDGSNYRRSYKTPYNIEGTDYYISNDWTWDGAPNLKAYEVIPQICKQDYVTETMKQQLQELAAEWSHSVPPPKKKNPPKLHVTSSTSAPRAQAKAICSTKKPKVSKVRKVERQLQNAVLQNMWSESHSTQNTPTLTLWAVINR